uniref:HMA2 transporter n=1 Tax=Sedum alfredii TaxID=439688 RepID=H9BFC6_9MAGN|nr:HMA2 transporter [Sedum alfredii]
MALGDEKATDDITKKQKSKFQKTYFDVLGLCCSSEVVLIENILKNLDGVKDISVIVPSRTVIVVHDELLISSLQIVKALNQARLEANVRNRGEANYRNKWPSPYAVFCGVLLVVSLFQFLFRPLRWVSLAAVAVGIFPIAWRSVIALKNLTLDINILAIFAVIGTIVLKDYLEAATIVFLFTIAEWLESRASHKATAVMSSLMNMAPQKAVIAETGEVVDADDVKINTILAVKAGEVVPIDGIVVEGESEVDEKTLTGESYPVPKRKDSTVLAGTMNLNGYISVKTTAIAEDCVVAKMAKLVEEAQNNKSRTQRFIDKCAKYYTPAVLLIAIMVAVIPAVMKVHNIDQWYHLALVVLVSACPCGLILSTPVATFCALSKAATSGLLIKGGDYLETLAKIKTMAFDKTGTITRGEFVVSDFRSLRADLPLSTLLYWVSSIESKSSHPMATALVDYGRSKSIEPKADEVGEYHSYPGEGIHGKIHGQHVYIGNKRMATRAHCASGPISEGESMEGKTIGYIYTGTTLAGMFSLSDACRSGAAEAVNELKNMGIRTVMLTGDSQAAANHAQAQLGNALERVYAELLPEDKARIIEELKRDGRVAMIGDGINDAPALATAYIGISMGIAGSALATETGNVILMSNDIRKVPEAIKLARRAQTKVVQNVILSVVTKGAILALAIAGHPLVWAAVLADVGTCLLVIFNSMLLLRGTSHHGHNHSHNHGHDHHHGKGVCKKADAHDHASHGHSHGCESEHTKCETKKDECGSKCGALVTEQSQSEKCCSSEANKNECCADADLIHRDNPCRGGEKNKKDCCGDEVADCCDNLEDETKVLCEAAKRLGQDDMSDKHVQDNTSNAVEESIIVVEEIQPKIHSHNHKTSKCCEAKKPHCSTDDKNPHEQTHTNNTTNCCKKKSQELAPPHCQPNHTHNHGHKPSEMDHTRHGCKSVAGVKREMGGCCKSYRKECCAHNKHGNFKKGLSEIVIE